MFSLTCQVSFVQQPSACILQQSSLSVLCYTCPKHFILLVWSTSSKSWKLSFESSQSEQTSSFALTLWIQSIQQYIKVNVITYIKESPNTSSSASESELSESTPVLCDLDLDAYKNEKKGNKQCLFDTPSHSNGQ